MPGTRIALASFAMVLVLASLGACGGREGAGEATKGPDEYFPIKVGGRTVRVQVAALSAEVQRGLMHRKSLGRDEGMLFVFMRPQQMGFWMRNTTIPLDIGYFDAAGELKEVYPLHPLDERSVTSRGRDLQFALEVNQGWFRDNGVRPGAKLDLDAVSGAIRARGLNPAQAGLR